MNLDPPQTAIIWQSVGIFICLIFSAIFSGSETALSSIPKAKVRQLVEEDGHKSLILWLEQPIPTLTTILVGNNIINVLASALATNLSNDLLAGTAHSGWAIPVAVGVMTLLLLTFGEITPKAFAKRNAIRVSLIVIHFIKLCYTLLYPIIWVFGRFTRLTMRILQDDDDDQAPFVTYEEIEYLIDLGGREGSIADERQKLLQSVVDFPDTLIREAMIPRTDTIAVESDISFQELLDILDKHGHSRIPVYEDSIDNILGIFYVKDMIRLLKNGFPQEEFNVKDHLRKVHFVPESKRIEDQLVEFQQQRVHIAIVVDEFGGTSGIITLEDIIEEIFGDIQDEYDAEDSPFEQTSEDTIVADARIPIYEIENFFEIEFPEHRDYDTLGGFLMAISGSVPKEGDVYQQQSLEYLILSADAKRVGSVKIKKLETEQTQE